MANTLLLLVVVDQFDFEMVAEVVRGGRTLQDPPHVWSLVALPEFLSPLLQMEMQVWISVQNSWMI